MGFPTVNLVGVMKLGESRIIAMISMGHVTANLAMLEPNVRIARKM